MGSALNPARPETFMFLDRLFDEMADLFPDQYFRVGGDEISGADWKAKVEVQAFMKANNLEENDARKRFHWFRLGSVISA